MGIKDFFSTFFVLFEENNPLLPKSLSIDTSIIYLINVCKVELGPDV